MASLGHVAVGTAAGRLFAKDSEEPEAWRSAAPWFAAASSWPAGVRGD